MIRHIRRVPKRDLGASLFAYMCKQYQKPKRSHHPPTPLHGAAVARVGRKTSTRGAVAVAVAVAKRVPPVVRVVVSHGRRTRVRARGFDWGVRACARGKFSSFVGIVHSFVWNAKNGSKNGGKRRASSFFYLFSVSSCTRTTFRRGTVSPDDRPGERAI